MKRNNSIFGNLDDVFLFCSVIEYGSLSKAADHLGLPASTISRRLNALQKRIGASILQPHKRELVATESGKRLYESLSPGLRQLDSALTHLQSDKHTLSGTVRIMVPRAFFYDVVRHSARVLRHRYPGITMVVTTNQTPLVGELDVDTDMLMTFDDLSELGGCVATPMYKTKLGIYAHRDFFKDTKRPETLADLANYPWISNYDVKSLAFYKEDALAEVIDVTPVFVVNDIEAVGDEVAAGGGIGMLPIAKARRHPEIERLFPEYNSKIRQSYLVYRKQRFHSRIIEVTVEQILKDSREWFADNDDWVG